MTAIEAPYPTGRRAASDTGVETLDADLRRDLRRASLTRQCFYAVVLLVAMAGQVTGAVQTLNIPLLWAIPAVSGLELGAVVVLANADVRRRLGERATASRLLSALIAGGAVTFNWLAHHDHLLGGFFAAMSALGYLTWLTHSENQRRDRLRATGDLPPTTPAYGILDHWLRHPWHTLRAKSLAKINPSLGLYGSLATAREHIRGEHRRKAITAVLHRKIRAAVDPATADIAVAVYDLDQIAARLAEQADYDTLTALISADLTPERLAPATTTTSQPDRPGPPLNPATAPTPIGPSPIPTGTTPIPTGTILVPAGGAAGTETVPAAGTHPTPPATDPPAFYAPTNDEDTAMYAAWRRAVTAGKQPSGVDLARAAGRRNDATGAGRRAARRYREAHARDQHRTDPGDSSPAIGTDDPTRLPPPDTGEPETRRHNGHHLTAAAATK